MKKIITFFLLVIAVPSFAQQSSVFLQNPILSAQNEVAFELPQDFYRVQKRCNGIVRLGARILASMNYTYSKDRAVARHGIAASVIIPWHPQWRGRCHRIER